jgi:hypothetical protein
MALFVDYQTKTRSNKKIKKKGKKTLRHEIFQTVTQENRRSVKLMNN